MRLIGGIWLKDRPVKRRASLVRRRRAEGRPVAVSSASRRPCGWPAGSPSGHSQRRRADRRRSDRQRSRERHRPHWAGRRHRADHQGAAVARSKPAGRRHKALTPAMFLHNAASALIVH
jgi:hypothetical protein